MRDRLRHLPNILSGARLAMLPGLWALAIGGHTRTVGWLLIAAAATDVLDGWLARRLDATTAFGAQLDSLADNLIAPSAAAWLVMLRPDIARAFQVPLMVWLAVYAVFLALGWLRFRRFGNLHLWSAKAGAVLAYLFIVHALLLPGIPAALFAVAIGVGLFGMLEGIACQILVERPDENAGSLFRMLRAAPRRAARAEQAERVAGRGKAAA